MRWPVLAVLALAACRQASPESSARTTDAAVDDARGAVAAPLDASSEASSDTAVEPDAASPRSFGFLCFPPEPDGFDPCPKGAMTPEGYEACLKRPTKRARPRFRVASHPWATFSPKRWRCQAAPLGAPTHVTVDTLAGLDETIPTTCASRTLDMQGPNTYGAIFFRCSTRDRTADEIVTDE